MTLPSRAVFCEVDLARPSTTPARWTLPVVGLEVENEIVGEDHPDTLAWAHNLAHVVTKLGEG